MTNNNTLNGFTYAEVVGKFSYDPETGEIRSRRFGKLLSGTDWAGYIKLTMTNKDKKTIQLYGHRVAYFIHHGSIDPSLTIDHIDGNSSNNRIANLRLVTQEVNLQNRKLYKNNKTGQIGVIQNSKGIYQVRIKYGNYGDYDNLSDAVTVAQEVYRIFEFGPSHGKAVEARVH
jgi:hypothetical protein